MPQSPYPLFQAIATAPTEQALRFRIMDNIGEYFGVQRWGIYLVDTDQNLASADARGVSDTLELLPYRRENAAKPYQIMLSGFVTDEASKSFPRGAFSLL